MMRSLVRNGVAAALPLLVGLWSAPGLAQQEKAGRGIVIGVDQRYPSEDRAVGRIVTVGCTGWLTSFGAVLTAGHCSGNGPFKIQFNVPLSNADGSINPPASANDSYPLTFFDFRAPGATGVAEDWAVAAVGAVNGMVPAVRQNAVFHLSSLSLPSGSSAVRVTGFGVDGPPPYYGVRTPQRSNTPRNSLSQTNQTAAGSYLGPATTASRICYLADTNPGDSGAPAMLNGSRIAIGIHVASNSAPGECGRVANVATALTQPNLVDAMQRFPGHFYAIPGNRTFFVDQESLSTAADGTVLSPFAQLSDGVTKAYAASGDTLITMAPGSYVDQQFTISLSHNITISLPAGDATLYLHRD